MCQVAVYLDDEKIMDDVMLVEPVPEGIRLVKLFEPPGCFCSTGPMRRFSGSLPFSLAWGQ
jgi:hypothetical protein